MNFSLTPFGHSHPLLTPQRYIHSIHVLAHSLCSLSRGTVEIHEYVFSLLSRFTGTNAFLVVTRNTPSVSLSNNEQTHHLLFRFPPTKMFHFQLSFVLLVFLPIFTANKTQKPKFIEDPRCVKLKSKVSLSITVLSGYIRPLHSKVKKSDSKLFFFFNIATQRCIQDAPN